MWGDADTRQVNAVGAYFHESPKVRPRFTYIDSRFLTSLTHRSVEEREVGRIATSARQRHVS